ncbi:MAG: ArsA-related P-loop ATPase [Myxococcota bacterium]
MPLALPAPLDVRLGLYSGKGGVGKSSVVAAVALAAAHSGRRPLVVEMGHRASMQDLFASAPIGLAPQRVHPAGVWACSLDPQETLRGYVHRYVPFRRWADRVLEHPALQRFYRAAPAVAELTALAHIGWLVDAGYDPVLVDLDATGHALMMLELPQILGRLGARGPVKRALRGITSWLEHPQTRLHIVTLPGALPVQETLELYANLAARPRIRLGAMVVNRIPTVPGHLTAAQLRRLHLDEHDADAASLAGDVTLAAARLRAHRAAADNLVRLAHEAPLPQVRLAEVPTLDGPARLRALLATATDTAMKEMTTTPRRPSPERR